jgi:cytochrome c-type biogenesis protein CcmH
MRAKLFGLLCGLAFCAQMAFAAINIYDFSTEDLRLRYQELIQELRCPKCQNQSLAGSDSPISADLRREIHRMLEDGLSDAQIKQFLVDRYGQFVLYEPPKSGNTLLVWILPAAMACIGLITIGLVLIRARRQAVQSGLDEGDDEF